MKIQYHQATEADQQIEIVTMDEPGNGGAYHEYIIRILGADLETKINFQNGPVETVPNGITIESLLAIAKHRLECFQEGPFASVYNDRALIYIDQALASLHERTAARRDAGVEGKMQSDPDLFQPKSILETILDAINRLCESGWKATEPEWKRKLCSNPDVRAIPPQTFDIDVEYPSSMRLAIVLAITDLCPNITAEDFPERFSYGSLIQHFSTNPDLE